MDENPLPVIILGLLSAALLVLPPVGYDVRLPKDAVTTQPPAPPGFAWWAAPIGESWKREKIAESRGVSHQKKVPLVDKYNDIQHSHTRDLHQLLNTKFDVGDASLETITSAQRLLQPTCLANVTQPLPGLSMLPIPLMVRAIDIYVDTKRNRAVLDLMNDLLRCGADPNPVEPSSGIDVLTRSASIASLEVINLIVDDFKGRMTKESGWAALARPDIGVGFVAAVRLMKRAVPMSVDLFRSRKLVASMLARSDAHGGKPTAEVAIAIAKAIKFPGANVHPRDLLLAGPTYGKIIDRLVGWSVEEKDEGSRARKSGLFYPRHGPEGTGTALEELSSAIFRQLLRAGSPLRLLSSSHQDKSNVLHIAAHSTTGMILNEIRVHAAAITRRSNTINGASSSAEIQLRHAILPLRTALQARDIHGRTPAHIASLLHGVNGNASRILSELARLVGIETPLNEQNEIVDNLGKSVKEYEINRNSAQVFFNPKTNAARSTGLAGGNWHVFGTAEELSSNLCNIEERFDFLSPEEFRDQYILQNRPVIIRRALQQANYDSTKRWSLPEVLRRFGDQRVAVGSIPYWNLFGTNGSVVNIVDFLSTFRYSPPTEVGVAPDYAFSSEPCTTWLDCDINMLPSFVRDIPEQRIEQIGQELKYNGDGTLHNLENSHRKVQVNKQFYMGGPRTGAPFHFHHDAVNVLLFGAKRWFLQPPAHATYSIEPPLDWFKRQSLSNEIYEYRHKYECVQHDGDVIFIPESWGHATLNVQASVGVAFELRFDQQDI